MWLVPKLIEHKPGGSLNGILQHTAISIISAGMSASRRNSEQFSFTSATRTSSTRCATRNWRQVGLGFLAELTRVAPKAGLCRN